jgi:hypothetical protein
MSATNALTKSVHQTVTPELRTSAVRSTRSRLAGKALTLFARAYVPQSPSHSIFPFSFLGILRLLGFWHWVPANSPSEMLAQKLKAFQFKLKCLALYQVLTKNFAETPEIPEISEMLKCHFGPWPSSHRLVSCLAKIWIGFRKLLLARLPPETVAETTPETFQAVSRNAETLALQMNHLREFALETIKKYLETIRYCIAWLRGTTVLILQSWCQSGEFVQMHSPPASEFEVPVPRGLLSATMGKPFGLVYNRTRRRRSITKAATPRKTIASTEETSGTGTMLPFANCPAER